MRVKVVYIIACSSFYILFGGGTCRPPWPPCQGTFFV